MNFLSKDDEFKPQILSEISEEDDASMISEWMNFKKKSSKTSRI